MYFFSLIRVFNVRYMFCCLVGKLGFVRRKIVYIFILIEIYKFWKIFKLFVNKVMILRVCGVDLILKR